jgi:hypothetical protein
MALRPHIERALAVRTLLRTPVIEETIMNMATGFDRRHPRGVILVRVLVTAWLLALTGILLAYGYWGWSLLTIAGAVANSVLAYRVWRTANALDPALAVHLRARLIAAAGPAEA